MAQSSDKLSIILSSPNHEAIQLAAMVASVASVSDTSVLIFVSMDAITKFRKGLPDAERMTGGQFSDRMREKRVPDFLDLFRQGKEFGDLKVYACSMALDMLEWKKEDLVDVIDDNAGLAQFLSEASGGQILHF